jgi:N-formylglutamate amidohydrolase
MTPLPIVVTTTHSGRAVPFEVLVEMLGEGVGDPEVCRRHLDWLYRQNDPFTDRIFHLPGAANLHAVVSRFVVDLNRDPDDLGPNGVVKRTDFDLTPLYPAGTTLTEHEVAERLARYWHPFHDSVERHVGAAELLIDGHAMTADGPQLGPDAGIARPAFCLMTGGDEHGDPIGEEPPSLSAAVARQAVDAFWRHVSPIVRQAPDVPSELALNRPFATGGVLRRYGQGGRVPALGIEINRALYFDEHDGVFLPRHDRIDLLRHAMRAFAGDLLTLVR